MSQRHVSWSGKNRRDSKLHSIHFASSPHHTMLTHHLCNSATMLLYLSHWVRTFTTAQHVISLSMHFHTITICHLTNPAPLATAQVSTSLIVHLHKCIREKWSLTKCAPPRQEHKVLWGGYDYRLLKIKSLYAEYRSLSYGSFAKETYNLKEPTNGSHPI